MTVVNALTKANEMATISASTATTAGAAAKTASTSEVVASSAANTIALKTERAAFLEAAAAAIFAAHAYIPLLVQEQPLVIFQQCLQNMLALQELFKVWLHLAKEVLLQEQILTEIRYWQG